MTNFKRRGKNPAAYRSGLESTIADQLREAGIPVAYETTTIVYVQEKGYTPDFVLPNGVVIETKGYFDPEDRRKHLDIQKQHPKLDIRFVFSNSKTKIRKGSKTSYADWCEKHGFPFADKRIPKDWM